jgi:cell division septum initiation protein DivIVA
MTGGPAKTATALQRVADSMTDDEKALYGKEFAEFTNALNRVQSAGLSAQASADRVVELVEQQPAPIRAAIGDDAEKILRLVREKSDAELDELRRHYVGLD